MSAGDRFATDSLPNEALPIVVATSPSIGAPTLTVTVDAVGNFEVRGMNRLGIPTILRIIADEVQERNRDPR